MYEARMEVRKALIRCPRCEYADGQIQTLAEILPNGIISIRRSRKTFKGEQETTLILGNNFELLCGRCQTLVFHRQLDQVITHESFKIVLGTI